ncbi:uncharacterized protein LOC122079557 [Macadamia integrifolia]|uniref:uncharacterized protein LOC122079557 n=1 Tax=Macadamia integrifolia TaxID=60698 RepID=UPI001C4F1A11|nr:uncharacterized protein LOC122079557 [Macadamia integrifolia]
MVDAEIDLCAMLTSINSTLLTLINDYKLKGPNYVDWHRSIMLLLTAEHLSGVLKEDAPEKPTGDDYDQQEAYEYFHSSDSKSMLYILRSIDKSIIDSMRSVISAKSMMDKLKKLFNQTDVHEHHELVGLIHNTKMTTKISVIDHVMKM